jgi:glycine betaine/proline transport system substrate-binding protein
MDRKKVLFISGLFFICCISIFAAGCTGNSEGTGQTTPTETVSIGYVLWDSEIASTNVIAQVMEMAGNEVELTAVDAGPLYQAVANGDVDFTVSAWLPATQANYWETYGDDIVFVRKNLEGARIGLVVPTYVTIDSIDEMNPVRSQFGGRITGIEPGAGIMQNTEEAIAEYGLEYELVPSSSAGMAAELTKAYDSGDWIVVTGWTPHWKFARFDLKYLEDPKGVYGGEEYIATLARQGLETDKPDIYAILTRFSWTAADMESVMLDIEKGMSEEEAAKQWIDAHPDVVAAWIGQN